MPNKYVQKFCHTCNQITLHNYNTCTKCSNRKTYYKHHDKHKARLLQKYKTESWNYSKTYTQKCLMAKRKNRQVLFTREEFKQWWQENPKICAYCGITEDQWNKTKTKFINIKRLTLDRIDNDKNYTLDNICWACVACNTKKSNRSL